jgi:hypothetical protein
VVAEPADRATAARAGLYRLTQLPGPCDHGNRGWPEQGEDWNHEVFPLIVDARDVLRANGVPIRPGSALCGAVAFCGNSLNPNGHGACPGTGSVLTPRTA